MPHDTSAVFAPFEERMRREELPPIVVDNFRHYYTVLAAGSTGLIAEDTIVPVAEAPHISETSVSVEAGQEAIRRTAVLKLNGGLGTSMGLDQAKSLLVAREGLTFLDIIARQTLRFRARYEARIPLILMNSFKTDADSQAVLARYPDLGSEMPLTVMQHKVPKVLKERLEPAVWPDDPSLEWCPPGHGELYIVLATSGVLDQLIDRGYEYLFVSNADNLGATLDAGIAGTIARQGIPFLMEVTRRTAADKKGGHIARRKEDGQLILREIAQCPEQDLPAFQDTERHRYFNTNNIWLNLIALKQILVQNDNVLKLPLIRNLKTLDPKDSRSPEVYQLETAMGAAIGVFPGAQVLHVERDRFLPVKTCNDLLLLRSDMYLLDDDARLRINPARRIDTTIVDLDPRYYKYITDFEARFAHVPSLLDCTQLKVEGDVAFEAGVVLEGAVTIVNRSREQRRLPGGTRLVNETRDLTEASL